MWKYKRNIRRTTKKGREEGIVNVSITDHWMKTSLVQQHLFLCPPPENWHTVQQQLGKPNQVFFQDPFADIEPCLGPSRMEVRCHTCSYSASKHTVDKNGQSQLTFPAKFSHAPFPSKQPAQPDSPAQQTCLPPEQGHGSA